MIFFTSGFRSIGHKYNPIPPNKSQTRFCSFTSVSEKFASCLENCKDFFSLRKLHACILAYGLGNSVFLGSKLLTCYVKVGSLAESRWAFDRITNNNLSLWNSVLVEYFRTGYFNEVLRRYLNLRETKIGLDSSAITFGLKSCIELAGFEFGRGIHVDAYKFGFNSHRYVGSSLVGLYAKQGDIEDASKVFDDITQKDVVVYTSMITGYAQIRDRRACQAFGVVCHMHKEGINPNRVTLVSLLQAAAQLEALEEGLSIHGYAIRRGIGCSDEVFETSLMDMYIKCGALRMAACIFGKMGAKSVGSWNAMIGGCLQMGQPLEALDLFCVMVRENMEPDLISFANGILCCADLNYLRQGKSIHGYIIRIGLQLDLVAITALVDLYSKCNRLSQAGRLFDRLEKKDVILYNVMMAGYIQNEFACEATETFIDMVGEDIKPNVSSILAVLSASSDLKDIIQGRSVHGHLLRHGFDSNKEISNQLIYMYAKCGFIDLARHVFNRIRYKDLVSWTSVMMGYVHNGHADKAILLFCLMQREKLDHDSVTLISLLQAFAQLGYLSLAKEVHCHIYRVHMDIEIPLINSLVTTYAKCGEIDMARDLFEHIIERDLASWSTMIAAYGMHGNCVEALKLFEQMRKDNLMPDKGTFTSILTACSHSGLVAEGLHAFRSMTEEYSIIPSEEHYNCMVDLLSRAGQLKEAHDLVKCFPSRQSASTLGALVAACRVYGNREMGEVIGRRLLDLEPRNSSAYALVSNLYAEGGKWDEVVRLRAMAKERSLKMTPGYSLIELDKQVCET